MSAFQEAKLWLGQLLGLPKDALHIYVGLAVFLGVAIASRRPLRSWLPLCVVFVAAVAGEVWDIVETYQLGARVHWWRNWHDVWNTCFWPAVLFLLARYTRLLKL